MTRKLFLILIISLLHVQFSIGQAMDNAVAYRDIPSDKYFRINYENDFFAAFDRDYTQGILIEKVCPSFSKFFLMKILIRPKQSELKYGIAIEHNAYTPNNIDKYEIQYGDRPYAGALMLKTFVIASNYEKRLRLSSAISAGVLGPWAGGEQMQRTIHHWINYTQPQGWHNQIQNDLILNYQVNAEKQILQYKNTFMISSYGSARVGTLSDKLSAGLTGMLGSFHSPFVKPVTGRRQFQWYAYCQFIGSAVGYDATLQGGLLNRTSVYTIDASDVNRLTLQSRYGLVLLFKSLYLEYYRTGMTEEFKTSIYHRTGGLQIGFGF